MVAALGRARVVGVLRAPSARTALEAALAAVRGGLRAIELTYTTPGVSEALSELRQRLPQDILLGAGTVMNAREAEEGIQAGADFLVSPHLGEDLLELCRGRGIPYIPGVLTPTEIVRARGLGAEVVKIFPAGTLGIRYLKDLRGPFPELQILATGGIQPSEVTAYLQTGVLAVGLGSNLFPKGAIQAGDWEAVEAATRQALSEAGLAQLG